MELARDRCRVAVHEVGRLVVVLRPGLVNADRDVRAVLRPGPRSFPEVRAHLAEGGICGGALVPVGDRAVLVEGPGLSPISAATVILAVLVRARTEGH